MTNPTTLRFHPLALGLGLAAAVFVACGSDDTTPSGTETLTFTGSDPLFPGLHYETGLLPPGSPVQASFAVSAGGATEVVAEAIASGSSSAPSLTSVPASGAITLSGGFALEGRLVVDISGLPSYDGPIPGIENTTIDFSATTAFDPFARDMPVSARADIPPADLPGIPLPGGIPGSLLLAVGEGSYVEIALLGTEVCASDDVGRYGVELTRAGLLVVSPRIEIEVPVLGTQTFDIPSVEVPLSLGATTLTMTAEIKSYGSAPAKGETVSERCSGPPVGSGGAGQGGGGEGGAGGGGPQACTTAADCGGLPCVEGTCSPGGGICDTGLSTGDPDVDLCLSTSCCQELDSCTDGYQSIQACNDCIADGGGPLCDAYIACATPCSGTPVCNSGVAVGDPDIGACLSDFCCQEFNDCTQNGTDVAACQACFAAGSGPLCDAALDCSLMACGV